MNALHRYVKKHPWLESTLRVAYWVGICAIPFLLLAVVLAVDWDVWATAKQAYAQLLSGAWDHAIGDVPYYAWEWVPGVALGFLIVTTLWVFVGFLLLRAKNVKLTPLRMYAASVGGGLLLIVLFLVLFLALVWHSLT